MVPLANSRRIPHAAVVEHGVGAMETAVNVAVGEAAVTGLLFSIQISLITPESSLFLLILYFCMIPTVHDHLRCHSLPCFLYHEHNLEEINLIDVIFTSIIKLDHAKAECSPVVCLDTSNDPGIEWLDI